MKVLSRITSQRSSVWSGNFAGLSAFISLSSGVEERLSI
ncbi:hypothetical protein M595_0113 [Lyngbya aestuarii BL J]|uniref:Uncharacterized protein n=1 Tax=Lyngbya aestuarii BL J TaxID=1348334 RepID=U7QRQ7_9CYAN|nr:hypothetical protein M595_0113 [Lyngbya aestuarii BL J]